jgi:hypothetical protein
VIERRTAGESAGVTYATVEESMILDEVYVLSPMTHNHFIRPGSRISH